MSEPVKAAVQRLEHAIIATWRLKDDQAGEWIELVGSHKSVQMSGLESGECVIEGSFDGAGSGYELHSPFGSSLKFLPGNHSENIAEATRFIRPRASGANPFTVTIMVIL